MARKIIPFSAILAVDGYEVIKTTTGGDLVTTCPWCKGDNLWVKDEKNTGHCWSCGKVSNPITFHMQACGISEYQKALLDAKSRIESGKYAEIIQVSEAKQKQSFVADILVRNKTYTTLFSYLSLDSKHEEDLLKRGIKTTFLYKTLDFNVLNEEDLIHYLLKNGCKLQGVAPFYYEGNSWHMKKYPRGILVPYLNRNGHIQGFQLRIDDQFLKPYKGQDGKIHTPSKYVWLSSGDKPHGTRGESYESYLVQFMNMESLRVPVFHGGICTITEGGMKADIAHQLSGKSFLALAGVNTQGARFKSELKALKSLGVKTIEIAFDMDRFLNVSVLTAIKKMCETVKENGFKLRILSWNTEFAYLDGTHSQLQMFQDFVFTPETYVKARDKERLPYIMDALKELGVENILFAFKNKEDALQNKNLYFELKNSYADKIITPIVWNLRLKGIDDFYAYETKRHL